MMSSPLPLGFFSHPAMLGWLAVAAAPLVLHLLNKRKYREAPWAAMRYLMAAVRKNSRRILVEQWILLALRTAILALVVLAVAEPIVERTGLGFVSREPRHKVLVVDGSYSMGYRASDQTLFDRAKGLAARIVEESGPGDAFTLVLLADPPRAVVSEPAFDQASMIDEIENLRLPHGGAKLPAALATIEGLLVRSRQSHRKLAREEIYFLTDLGRATWASDLSSEAEAELRERIERLAKSSVMQLVDLGQENAENVAIARVRTTRPFVTLGASVEIEADIRNFGAQPRPRQLVELHVDGRRSAEQHVDLDAGGSATAIFSYRFDTPGDHAIEVRLAHDLLDIDDHRWLALPVREHLNVLCVNGRAAEGAVGGSAEYLAVALAPFDDSAAAQPVRVEVAAESALVERDLGEFDCVFLADVAQFTPSEASILETYLENGGGLVFFLGPNVRAESYNRFLVKHGEEGAAVLPARLGGTAAEGQYLFDPLDYEHPLVEAFRARDRAGLLTSYAQRYVRLEPIAELHARTALAFNNGDPAIVEAQVARGRSIVVATSADVSWTMLPVWHSYLPIVQELLTLAVRGRLDERNALDGAGLSRTVRAPSADVRATIHAPQDQTRGMRLDSDGAYSHWSYPETWDSGLYWVDYDTPRLPREV